MGAPPDRRLARPWPAGRGVGGFRTDNDLAVGVAVGLRGGFATFSTFAVDAIHLWEHGYGTKAVFSVS